MRELDVAAALRLVREQAPLVHAVSNIVTVNDCANVLLPGDPFTAAVAAAACLGACGVRADKLGRAKGTGTATFRTDFMDGVSLITPEQLEEALDYDWI